MKSTITKVFKIIIYVGIVSIITVGCTPQKPTPFVNDCPLPSGHLIDQAFATAKTTLSNPECKYKFDDVITSLLKVCEGAPDIKNKELFSELLLWAKDQGIISKVQAERYYTKYFSYRFVSLPGDYQIKSYCPKLASIIGECKDELASKELGLLKVCKDNESYTKAYNDLQETELILEATCVACAAE